MSNVASKYSQEASEKRLNEIYGEIVNQRIALFNSALQPVQSVIPSTPVAVAILSGDTVQIPTQTVDILLPPVNEEK